MTSQCPNEFPTTSASYRIALCGEAPGEREVALHRPFVGAAGAHLDRMLAGAGILRSACFVGNVCQVRPPGNDFATLDWGSAEVQDGIEALLADLAQFRPNLVVTLGNVPLHLFRKGNCNLPRHKRNSKLAYDWPSKVTTWRGSLFMSSPRVWERNARALTPSPEVVAACLGKPIENPSRAPQALEAAGASPALAFNLAAAVDAAAIGESTVAAPESVNNQQLTAGSSTGTRAEPAPPAPTCPHCGGALDVDGYGSNWCCEDTRLPLRARPQWKCLATLHPAYTLRAWAENFNLRQDLRRARAEGESSALVLPELDFQYGP